METPDKNLTAQESLEIITAMINQAKGNAKDNSVYFLLWGWLVIVANLISYTLHAINYNMPFLAWLVVIPGWGITIYIGRKHSGKIQNRTHLDRVTTALWISFSIVTLSLIFFGYKINFQLNPLILLLVSIPTFVSGIILKFKPLIVGGILFWFFGLINFFVPLEYQNLIGALAMICGYLIPGYLLKGESKKHV
jgi:hypothetical protein